jgi:hypothetical protein
MDNWIEGMPAPWIEPKLLDCRNSANPVLWIPLGNAVGEGRFCAFFSLCDKAATKWSVVLLPALQSKEE